MTEINIYDDLDFRGFSELFRDLRQKANMNFTNGKQKTLFFVYYAGHGVMDNYTEAVCNGGEKATKLRYKLEENLIALSQNPGCVVTAIFACCRAKLSNEMRGGVQNRSVEDIDEDQKYIFFYGCPPNSGVQANSNISIDFFVELKKQANNEDGSVILPTAMQFFETEDGGSMAAKIKFPLRLVYPDWVPKPSAGDNDITGIFPDDEVAAI